MINEKILRKREQRLRWYHKNKEQEKPKMIEWRRLNPERTKGYREKSRFEYQVRALTDRGFKRGNKCSFCKTESSPLQFHHWVYKKPVERKHFSVFCNDCHKLIHRTMRGVRKSQTGQL